MATDLTIFLEDRPGELARLGRATGDAGVNLEGFVGITRNGRGEIHVLVEDAGAARSALAGAGIDVATEQEVVVTSIEDKPGALGEAAQRIADAGVNITLAYLATNTRLVIGADDLAKARDAL